MARRHPRADFRGVAPVVVLVLFLVGGTAALAWTIVAAAATSSVDPLAPFTISSRAGASSTVPAGGALAGALAALVPLSTMWVVCILHLLGRTRAASIAFGVALAGASLPLLALWIALVALGEAWPALGWGIAALASLALIPCGVAFARLVGRALPGD